MPQRPRHISVKHWMKVVSQDISQDIQKENTLNESLSKNSVLGIENCHEKSLKNKKTNLRNT